MKLTDFKMLTFDTYGTLIDWETGIYEGLAPLLDKLPIRLERDEVLELFGHHPDAMVADVQKRVDALIAQKRLTKKASKSVVKGYAESLDGYTYLDFR